MDNLSEEDAHYRAICSRVTVQSDKKGFFKELADTLAADVDFAAFYHCSTDLERFKLIADSCWDKINAELIFRGKNAEVSTQKRLEGNKLFEQNNLNKALLCYCQSLVQAPVGSELISTYTNRSALLFKMGEFQAAIDDAELAISYGSLEQSKHKLYERMTSCYISLKNYPKAKVTLRLAKHLAEKHDPTNDKFLKKLDKYSSQLDKIAKDTTKDKPGPTQDGLPEGMTFTPGPVFTSASPKFGVEYSPGAGRFAVATEKITPGEILLVEKPFAAVLNLDQMGFRCTNCFIRFKVPIPCETCSHVAYCSRKCRKEAQESFHQYECKTMALLMGSGMSANGFLALRIITQSSVDKFKEIFPELEINPGKVPYSANGKFDGNAYMSIYNLGGLGHMRSPVDFYERTLLAVFLIKCLRLNQYFQINLFKSPKPTPEEMLIGGLLVRNLQVLQFNAYEVCEFLMENKTDYKKGTTRSIALAIYPTASYFNHSCAPDVTRIFNGKTMIVQSIKGIEANQPIYDNYGPLFTKMELKARQRRLCGRYWFTCSCSACQQDWPLLMSFPLELEPLNVAERKALKKLQSLEQTYFEEGMKAMERAKALHAVEMFKRFIAEAEATLGTLPAGRFVPYKTIVLAQEGIKICLCTLGSVFIAGENLVK